MNRRRFRNIIFKIIRYSLNIIYLLDKKTFNKVFYYYLKKIGVNIQGTPSFISRDVYLDPSDYTKITIGDNSVISINVTILVHDYSITRAMVACGKPVTKELSLVKEVKIGRNCFIGAGTIILPGTIIGDNTIIGAGSIVKGKIPSNVVAAGNPCRVICTIEEFLDKQYKINKNYLKTDV